MFPSSNYKVLVMVLLHGWYIVGGNEEFLNPKIQVLLSFSDITNALLNWAKFSTKHTPSQSSSSKLAAPISRAERVIWTEADCHGMTNDGWLQFNYTQGITYLWLARNKWSFSIPFTVCGITAIYLCHFFFIQIWCVCEKTHTLTISVSPTGIYNAHIPIVLAADYSY